MTQRLPRRIRRGPDRVRRPQPARSVGVVLHDANGRILVASEQAAHMLGVAQPEVLTGRLGIFEGGTVVRPDGSVCATEEQPAAVVLRTGETQDEVLLGFCRQG